MELWRPLSFSILLAALIQRNHSRSPKLKFKNTGSDLLEDLPSLVLYDYIQVSKAEYEESIFVRLNISCRGGAETVVLPHQGGEGS